MTAGGAARLYTHQTSISISGFMSLSIAIYVYIYIEYHMFSTILGV